MSSRTLLLGWGRERKDLVFCGVHVFLLPLADDKLRNRTLLVFALVRWRRWRAFFLPRRRRWSTLMALPFLLLALNSDDLFKKFPRAIVHVVKGWGWEGRSRSGGGDRRRHL